MKNFKKKALLPAIAMVMVSIIALSGATYAWFTVGDTAQIDTLDVKVVPASGIQFSLDAAIWKSSLTKDEIVEAGIFPAEGDLVEPISTNGVTNSNGRLNFFSASVNGDGEHLTSAEVAPISEANGVIQKGTADYIAFDLYVKVNKPATLYLDDEMSAVTSANGGKGCIATRVAFVNQGYIGLDEAPDKVKNKQNENTAAVIWEPNSTEHAKDALSMGTSKEGGIANNPYKGITGVNDSIPNVPNGNSDYLASVSTIETIGVRDTAKIAELEAGISKISVTIWLEGQDGDCVNSISGGDISTVLKFKKVDKE